MTMTTTSIRLPDELAGFFDKLSEAYPDRFPTRADAVRAAMEFYRDFHLNLPAIERNIIENFEATSPSLKRMVLDIPKDHYNMLRDIQYMGRAASVPELLRTFLRRFIKAEIKAVQREKDELRRAQEASRAHDNELRMRDSHLTR